jgi:hypothetical protein
VHGRRHVELKDADLPEASQPSRVAAAPLLSGHHQNFLGQNDPYGARKSETDAAVSPPFPGADEWTHRRKASQRSARRTDESLPRRVTPQQRTHVGELVYAGTSTYVEVE